MSNIYNKRVPRLFDEAVGYLQQALQGDAMFSQYLDNIFGIAERTVKKIDGRNYFSPSWFVNGYDYINLLPDDELGNYVFFTLDEPQEIEHEQGLQNRYTCGFNIILWAKFDSNIDTYQDRNREAVKSDFLRVIEGAWMRRGYFHIDRIYERAENVFQGFTTDEVDNQYMMQPYYGYRFHGEITISDICD